MSILGAIAVPHPPLIIPAVGRGQERGISATVDAYRAAARRVAEWGPDTIILTTPHSVMYADYFHISPGSAANGDMRRFGAPQERLEVKYDAELRKEAVSLAEAEGISAGTLGERDASLDHGAFIPLWFLREAGVNARSCAWDSPAFPRLSTISLGAASRARLTSWEGALCLSPAATFRTS